MFTTDQLERILTGRIRDLARTPDVPLAERAEHLLQILGLKNREEWLTAELTSISVDEREGYVFEVLHSSFGYTHFYRPAADPNGKLLISTDGHDVEGPNLHHIQARGISFALQGYTVAIVQTPSEVRHAQLDSAWSFSPLTYGVLALSNALTQVSKKETVSTSAALIGEAGASLLAILTFVLDHRFEALALAGGFASLEENPQITTTTAPDLATLGDWSHILAIAAPKPVLLMSNKESQLGAESRTADKLRGQNRAYRNERVLRAETFEGPVDFNRRMRETTLGFFGEMLLSRPATDYVAEARPLTDGRAVPYVAGTVDLTVPEIEATSPLEFIPAPLEPVPYVGLNRLVPWGRYDRLEQLQLSGTLVIADEGLESANAHWVLPKDETLAEMCLFCGVGYPEFLAQLLHWRLPGSPLSWQSAGLGGDAITSVIASVQTLFHKADSSAKFDSVDASGPLASLTALFLSQLRPEIPIKTTHSFTSWAEVEALQDRTLIMPLAARWSFPTDPKGQI